MDTTSRTLFPKPADRLAAIRLAADIAAARHHIAAEWHTTPGRVPFDIVATRVAAQRQLDRIRVTEQQP